MSLYLLSKYHANTSKMTEYTNSIKIDLKNDVRRLEGVVESIERSSKTDQRLTDSGMKEIKRDVDSTLKDINKELLKSQKDQQAEIKALKNEVDNKIKQALDNPLAKN